MLSSLLQEIKRQRKRYRKVYVQTQATFSRQIRIMTDLGLIKVETLTPQLIVVKDFKNIRILDDGEPFVVARVVGKSLFSSKQSEFTAPNKKFNLKDTDVVTGAFIRASPDMETMRTVDEKIYPLVPGSQVINGIEQLSVDVNPDTKRVILKGV